MRHWRKRRRCWCSKKSGRDLGGGKGREIGLEDRLRCRELIEEAVGNGARLFKACEVMGITVRTYQRGGKDRARADARHDPRGSPANSLSEEERERTVAVATCRGHTIALLCTSDQVAQVGSSHRSLLLPSA